MIISNVSCGKLLFNVIFSLSSLISVESMAIFIEEVAEFNVIDILWKLLSFGK